MNIAVPFPEKLPYGYKCLSEEPIFDPLKHLSLQFPSEMFSLEDLGYTPEEIEDKATTFGISEPLRILSAEGTEICLVSAPQLLRL